MFYVHLLASKPYGIGTTSDLARRVWEDKNNRLVWFEAPDSAADALRREKQLKEWKRDWKINLLERDNPHWADLHPTRRL